MVWIISSHIGCRRKKKGVQPNRVAGDLSETAESRITRPFSHVAQLECEPALPADEAHYPHSCFLTRPEVRGVRLLFL